MSGLYIILAHLVGDYIIQNNWMAQKKTSAWWPAIVHGVVYSIPYAFVLWLLTGSVLEYWPALLVIGGTHVVIDRFRLVKQMIWALNQVAPRASRYSWAEAKQNGGYSAGMPVWMSTWLMIIVDNSCHLVINTVAIVLATGIGWSVGA